MLTNQKTLKKFCKNFNANYGSSFTSVDDSLFNRAKREFGVDNEGFIRFCEAIIRCEVYRYNEAHPRKVNLLDSKELAENLINSIEGNK